MRIECSNNQDFFSKLSTDVSKIKVGESKSYKIVSPEKTIEISVAVREIFYNISKITLTEPFDITIKAKKNEVTDEELSSLIESIERSISNIRPLANSFNQVIVRVEKKVFKEPLTTHGDFNL